MCGRFGLANPHRLAAIAALHTAMAEAGADPPRPATVTADAAALLEAPRYNIAPSQPVVAARTRRRDGRPGGRSPERRVGVLRWGLIPSWAKDPAIGNGLANARAETVDHKPSFRGPWQAGQRCLVFADVFYEWRDAGDVEADPRNGDVGTTGRRPVARAPKPPKQPFAIRFEDDAPFAFGALWDAWRAPAADRDDPAAWVATCTLITTAPNAVMRPIHDRMPVIVPPAAYDAWLDPALPPDEAKGMLTPYAPEAMRAYAVSRAVNDPRHDGPDVLEPHPADA